MKLANGRIVLHEQEQGQPQRTTDNFLSTVNAGLLLIDERACVAVKTT